MTAPDRVYTVTELTREIRSTLEEAFPAVWVEGEVSNFRAPASGHLYFSVKDEESMLKCVMFRNAGSRLKFSVEDGMHVLLSGRIGVYDKQGQYQLYVDVIEPKGKGALYAAFEQLKEKLYKEGLFDEARKKPVPYLPVRVGVVTSATGAAIRDILNVARRRFSNIEITICPAKVQGEGAKEEIAGAIEALNEYNRYIVQEALAEEHPIDVMIVGRGGGSIEDLWAFNEETVARAIAASDIPVISAVGHEVDYTISDFVADHRAPTPSAAAELVIPRKEDLLESVRTLAGRMESALGGRIEMLEERLAGIRDKYVLREPVNVILQLSQRVDEMERRAATEMAHHLEMKTGALGRSRGKLDTLSPVAVLARGYSITFSGGVAVKDSAMLGKGDEIETRFASGRARSRVESADRD